MKPTSPEDRELEQLGADVSARYRANSNEEPPQRLDAEILEAARRQVQRPRLRRNWQLPAAIAAVLVIGVSLALMTREIVEPLAPLERSAEQKAKLAKPDAPRLAMQAEPKPAPRRKIDLDSRPSRERGERIDREADMRPGTGLAVGRTDQAASQPAAPALAAPAPPAAVAEAQAPAAALEPQKITAASARKEMGAKALRKEAAVAATTPAQPPQQWLRKIEDLLRDGKTNEVREQMLEFRKHYPDYPLPEKLRIFGSVTGQEPR